LKSISKGEFNASGSVNLVTIGSFHTFLFLDTYSSYFLVMTSCVFSALSTIALIEHLCLFLINRSTISLALVIIATTSPYPDTFSSAMWKELIAF